MIVKKEQRKSKFLDFILVQEADDDPPKRNRKVIQLKAGDGRRVDLSKGAEIEDDEPEVDEPTTPDDTDAGEDTTNADTGISEEDDFSDGAEIGDDTGGEDAGDEDMGGDGEDEDFSDGADVGEDDAGDDTGGEDAGDEDMGGDGEDEDFSDGADVGEDDAGDDTGGEDNSSDGGDSSNDSSDDDKSFDEQVRKYALYRKFLKLNKLLDSNIEMLSNVLSDDAEINKSYKKIIKKLKETNNLLSEYMVIKFQNASYIQSMLFYQRILAIVNINFNALSDIRKEIDKNNKE